MLAVFDRRLEWLREVFGDKNREVRVVCLVFLGLIGVAVDNGQSVFVVFCGDLSGRIRTEGTHLVVKGRCVVDQLRFIEVLV